MIIPSRASDANFLENKLILSCYGKLVMAYNQLYQDLYEIINNKEALARFEPHLRDITYG